jgi:hypothetical protein
VHEERATKGVVAFVDFCWLSFAVLQTSIVIVNKKRVLRLVLCVKETSLYLPEPG